MTTEKAIIKSFSFLFAGNNDEVKAFIGLELNAGKRVSGLVLFKLQNGVWRLDNQREISQNRELGISLTQVLDAHQCGRELCITFDYEIELNQLYRITFTEFDQT
jgi:hypothetical protein